MITPVAHVIAGSSGGGTFTTSAIDTTGASLIVIAVPSYTGASVPTPSDSKSNVWNALTDIGQGGERLDVYYATNTTGKVGTGHTFTVTQVGITSFYGSIAVLAFAGAHATAPFDAENGLANSASTTSIQPGSVSPFENNEVICSFLSNDNNAISSVAIDSSFSIIDSLPYSSGNHFGLYSAYIIETVSGAKNPTWSWTTAVGKNAKIAAFKSTNGALVGGSHNQGIIIY